MQKLPSEQSYIHPSYADHTWRRPTFSHSNVIGMKMLFNDVTWEWYSGITHGADAVRVRGAARETLYYYGREKRGDGTPSI